MKMKTKKSTKKNTTIFLSEHLHKQHTKIHAKQTKQVRTNETKQKKNKNLFIIYKKK